MDELIAGDPDSAELAMRALIREAGIIAESLGHIEASRSEFSAREAALRAERGDVSKMLDAGMTALGEEGARLKGLSAGSEEKMKAIDDRLARLGSERAEFDIRVERERATLAAMLESREGSSTYNDKMTLATLEASLAEISGYAIADTKNLEAVIIKIDDLLFQIAKLKITPFGILMGKDRIDKVEADLQKEKRRFEAAVTANRGSARNGNMPPRSPGMAESPESTTPRNTRRSNGIMRAIRRELGTTRGKVAQTIGVLAVFGGIYYAAYHSGKGSPELAEFAQQGEIVSFHSEKEAVEKGYIVIKGGQKLPKDGYEWAYTTEESETFPKNDPRRYAVKKIQ